MQYLLCLLQLESFFIGIQLSTGFILSYCLFSFVVIIFSSITYVCTVFTHNTYIPRTDSPTSTKPTGYPTIQSNSDTNCLDWHQTPQV